MNCSGTHFLHTDHEGSIIAVADCNGNRQAVDTYDEYGIPGTGNYTGSLPQRFQYTGQIWLPELGMYYYKARMYSPTLGRFMQTDPIGYADQVNLYAYVGNDPVNHEDPSGESCTGTNSSTCEGGLAPGSSGFSTASPTGNGSFNHPNAIKPGEPQRAGATILENRGGKQRGDPGRTSKPEGSGNPDKKFKPGDKPGTRIFNDPTTGKPVVKPWPGDGRRGGDGTGVHPGSKYPDGTPVNPDGNKSRTVVGGLAVLGAIGCAIVQPCGAAMVTALGLGGTTILVTQ